MKSLVILLVMVGFGQSAIHQFRSMINCACTRSATDFNGYGCHCGRGGSGDWVDNIDRCCKYHDDCWDALEEGDCSNDDPLLEYYTFSQTGCGYRPNINCEDSSNNDCERGVCRCDRAAAFCFRAYEASFDTCYENYDKSTC
ncbi:neutral phospholipase A2 3-like [Apostichopus japonicus]|uniref:neutral phospholipase A2 3-like n=1 Tax=Stichopus japonicus TaxID=307972 RepID=UPI003AB13EAD